METTKALTRERALSYAILALNTLVHPDATSDADFEEMDAHAEESIAVLVQMRDAEVQGERATAALALLEERDA